MRGELKNKAAAIRERIANGENCCQIARDLGISEASVYGIRDNRVYPGLGPDVSGMNQQAQTFERARLLKDLSKTMSAIEAAGVLGISRATVDNYARSYGIKFPRKARGPRGIRVVRKITSLLKKAGFTREDIETYRAHHGDE